MNTAVPRAAGAVAFGVLVLTSYAGAVEKGQFGLNAQLHTQRSLGLTYHATSRIAVRPSFFLERTTSDEVPALVDATQDIPVFDTTTTVFGGGLDLLYFLRPARDLAPYAGLLLSYAHINEPYPVRSPGRLVLRNGNRGQVGVSAAFGVQYAFTERFHAYSDVAAGYSRTERFAIDGIRLRSRTWGTASTALGAVFYFN